MEIKLRETTISFTGDFIDRQKIEEVLSAQGIKLSKDLSKKVNYLCVGNNAKDYKIQEAKRLNLPILSHTFFEDILSGKTPDFTQHLVSADPGKRKRKLSEMGQLVTKKTRNDQGTVPTSTKSKVIALEGEIGAGKSTLCRKFETTYPEDCSSYQEQTNEQFLKLFYGDPKKYGFAFQWGMLKSRIYQLMLARHNARNPESPPKKYYFWDRSMLGDYMFALWNHLLGGISRDEMDVYESEFGGNFRRLSQVPFLKEIDCFVLLNDEPSQCKYRVEQKRKNPSEQGIPIDYYEGLDDMHFNIFMKLLSEKIGPVLILNWGQYHDATQTLALVEEVCNGIRPTPTVQYVEASRVPDEKELRKKTNKAYVYTNEEQVIQAYTEMSVQGDIMDLHDLRDIYIPSNIMKIGNKQKKVIENDYGIAFHKNEYKRVVLYHLSRFQNIIFYK